MGWFGLSKNFNIYRTNNALQWDFAAKFKPVLIDAPVLTLPPPEVPSVRSPNLLQTSDSIVIMEIGFFIGTNRSNKTSS